MVLKVPWYHTCTMQVCLHATHLLYKLTRPGSNLQSVVIPIPFQSTWRRINLQTIIMMIMFDMYTRNSMDWSISKEHTNVDPWIIKSTNEPTRGSSIAGLYKRSVAEGAGLSTRPKPLSSSTSSLPQIPSCVAGTSTPCTAVQSLMCGYRRGATAVRWCWLGGN